MQTYNLFRRQNEEDLYCAVPEDVPVPPFVTDERWEWAQSLDVSQLSGFDAKAAEISANRNGFYLFHSTVLTDRRCTGSACLHAVVPRGTGEELNQLRIDQAIDQV